MVKKSNDGNLIYHNAYRFQNDPYGYEKGEWGYKIKKIIKSNYQNYSLSDLFKDIEKPTNSPPIVLPLIDYLDPDKYHLLEELNISSSEFDKIKEKLEQQYNDTSNILVEPKDNKQGSSCSTTIG